MPDISFGTATSDHPARGDETRCRSMPGTSPWDHPARGRYSLICGGALWKKGIADSLAVASAARHSNGHFVHYAIDGVLCGQWKKPAALERARIATSDDPAANAMVVVHWSRLAAADCLWAVAGRDWRANHPLCSPATSGDQKFWEDRLIQWASPRRATTLAASSE
jgi:hypothetical protein